MHVSLNVNAFAAVGFMLCCFFCFKLLLVPLVVNKDDYKNRPRNDLLCVEWNVNTLIPRDFWHK